jgi:predicted Zn finger-like uncharacterized protein
MIVQCEACQTRFRLADEKVKVGGIKVRCSKCKEVFTVMPPEPEPVEETVDFGSFNMEKVADEAPAGETPTNEEPPSETSATEDAAPPEESTQEESSDLDFSGLESEKGTAVPKDELADEFSFVDTSQLQDRGIEAEEDTSEENALDESTDFNDAFSKTDEPDGAMEFEFNEEPEASESASSDEIDFSTDSPAASDEIDFSTDESSGVDEFSFPTREDTNEQEPSDQFSFDDDSGDDAFDFGDAEEESPTPASEETSEPDEFSFDDEDPFADDSSSEWEEKTASDVTSFDFEEPQFDNNETEEESPVAQSGSDDLQFGEIDFASDTAEEEAPGFDSDEDFSSASMEQKEEPESFSPSQESSRPPADDYDDEKPLLPAPPPPKKSSLSRILVLLVLLLIILGGAAGFLFIQEGAINLKTIGQYLPFLQEYIGEAPVSSPGDRIGINVSGSSYVNGEAGQMLVIQGAAVNNHPATRSAITIKGILLDAQGQTLLQQTVFCGNKLDDAAIKTMSFAAIEEAMNNQFGDSLSNMNVAAGATIPFTIVFRNLPDGLANINVEVVDSKPGAG